MRPNTWTRPTAFSPVYRPAPTMPPMTIVPRVGDVVPMQSMPIALGDFGSAMLVDSVVMIVIGAVGGVALYKAYAKRPSRIGTVASALVGPIALGAAVRIVTALTPA